MEISLEPKPTLLLVFSLFQILSMLQFLYIETGMIVLFFLFIGYLPGGREQTYSVAGDFCTYDTLIYLSWKETCQQGHSHSELPALSQCMKIKQLIIQTLPNDQLIFSLLCFRESEGICLTAWKLSVSHSYFLN